MRVDQRGIPGMRVDQRGIPGMRVGQAVLLDLRVRFGQKVKALLKQQASPAEHLKCFTR